MHIEWSPSEEGGGGGGVTPLLDVDFGSDVDFVVFVFCAGRQGDDADVYTLYHETLADALWQSGSVVCRLRLCLDSHSLYKTKKINSFTKPRDPMVV